MTEVATNQTNPDYDLLRQIIALGRRHEHYDRTVEVAEWSYKMAAGTDQSDIIDSFRKRETEDQKEQRARIFKTLTKYAIQQVRAMYNKIRRVEGVQVSIEVDGSQEERLSKLNEAHKLYATKKSLTEWLHDRQEHYSFHDPNAYLIPERKIIKAADGQAQGNMLYPVEVSSSDVVWLSWDDRGEVEVIVIRVWVTEDVEKDDGNFEVVKHANFYLYRKGRCVEAFCGPLAGRNDLESYEKVVWKNKVKYNPDWTTGGTPGDESGHGTKYSVANDSVKDHTYYLKTHDTGTPEVPAIATGSQLDPETNGRTFLTEFHAADKILEELVNVKSEADLTRLLHVFPKLFQYAPACTFKHKTPSGPVKTCNGGYLDVKKEEKCPQCKGTGLNVHTSQQDVVYVGWPKAQDSLIDLKKIAAYLTPEQWLAEHQDKAIETILSRVSKAIFNTEAFQKPTIANTATEVGIEYEKVYDRITSYASHNSAIFELFVRVNASYFEIKEIEVRHAYPSDYKFESKLELLGQLKLAKESGAGFDTIRAFERDLNSKLYQNQPGVVEEIEALNSLRPFQDLSEEQRMVTLASLPPTNRLRVSYEYAYIITQRIQVELGERSFAELPVAKRRDMWDKAVDEVISELPQGGSERTLFQNPTPEPEPVA